MWMSGGFGAGTAVAVADGFGGGVHFGPFVLACALGATEAAPPGSGLGASAEIDGTTGRLGSGAAVGPPPALVPSFGAGRRVKITTASVTTPAASATIASTSGQLRERAGSGAATTAELIESPVPVFIGTGVSA